MQRAVRDADRPADDLIDALEERAAIIEEGCGVSRAEAERRAAKLAGFDNWNAAMAAWRPR